MTRVNIKKPDKASCHYCYRPLNKGEIEFDHKIPLIKGGHNLPENIVFACEVCNRCKSGMDYDVFLSWLKVVPILSGVPLDNPRLISLAISGWTRYIIARMAIDAHSLEEGTETKI